MANFNFTEGSGKTGAAVDIGGVLHPKVIATESDGSDTALAAKLGALTETAPASDTASSGLNGRLQRIAQRITSLIALLPSALGQTTKSGSLAVTLASDDDVQGKLGSLTETAPASDTASSGLNGRLQRIAQRLSSLIALLPTSLGANGGLKIEGVASGTAVPVSLASVPSHAVTEADGSNVTLGSKADAKSTATDTTAITIMSVLKQVSASVQAIASSVAGTLAISAASLPLPSGAATSANQSTGNTSLSNIDTNAGATSDAIATAGSTGTISAKLRRVTQGLEDLKTLIVLAAGTNLIGKIVAGIDTSTIYNGTTALTPKFATIVASSSGATTIVAAVTSKKIRVIALQLVANAAVNVKWQSHVTPTDKTGLAYLAANGGYVLPKNEYGWFETVAGEALDINLSGAVAVGGSLVYVEV